MSQDTERDAHFAGNCLICGAAIDQQALDEWCSSTPPWCWKCGSFYFVEGSVYDDTAGGARDRAARFDQRITEAIQ